MLRRASKRLLILNSSLVVISILLYSPGFIGLSVNGINPLVSAFAITLGFVILASFIAGNYICLTMKEKTVQVIHIQTFKDCIEALKCNSYKISFQQDISSVLVQVERFEKKKSRVHEVLLQKFDKTEMSYMKFNSVIDQVQRLFFENTRSIVNKINIFDEDEFSFANRNIHQEISREKVGIYNEYFLFVKKGIEDNEVLLLKFDKLLLELSKFNSLEDGEIENMPAIQEIDELIQKTKFYK